MILLRGLPASVAFAQAVSSLTLNSKPFCGKILTCEDEAMNGPEVETVRLQPHGLKS